MKILLLLTFLLSTSFVNANTYKSLYKNSQEFEKHEEHIHCFNKALIQGAEIIYRNLGFEPLEYNPPESEWIIELEDLLRNKVFESPVVANAYLYESCLSTTVSSEQIQKFETCFFYNFQFENIFYDQKSGKTLLDTKKNIDAIPDLNEDIIQYIKNHAQTIYLTYPDEMEYYIQHFLYCAYS